MDVHEGLFFSRFDYGYGNEWVPYIKSEMETTLILICIIVAMAWAIPTAIKMMKNYEEVRFYRNFFVVLMIIGGFISYFSIAIWGDMVLTGTLIIIDVIGGTFLCVIGELLDDKVEQERERKARFRRQRQIRRYIRERGRRR